MIELPPPTFEGHGEQGGGVDNALYAIFGEVARVIGMRSKITKGQLIFLSTYDHHHPPSLELQITDEEGRDIGVAFFMQDHFGNFVFYVGFDQGIHHFWIRVGRDLHGAKDAKFFYLSVDGTRESRGHSIVEFLLLALEGMFNAKEEGNHHKARIMEYLVLKALKNWGAINNEWEALRYFIQVLQEMGLLTLM